jgi:hypothetical protein
VNDELASLFIEDWIISINYSSYFDQCHPSICTFSTTNRINLSSAITLFTSLYGGLIIILRLLAPILIKIIFKLKGPQTIIPTHRGIVSIQEKWSFILIVFCWSCLAFQHQRLQKFVRFLQKLNLFKKITARTPDNIKQQRIIDFYWKLSWLKKHDFVFRHNSSQTNHLIHTHTLFIIRTVTAFMTEFSAEFLT